MPEGHSQHEEDRDGSDSELPGGKSAANDDGGDEESPQGQGVRQPNLGDASQRETAVRLGDTEEDEALRRTTEVSMGFDKENEDPKKRIPEINIPGQAEGMALWQDEEKFHLAREMIEAGVPFEEVAEQFGAAFDPDNWLREVKEAEVRHAEREGGTEAPPGSPQFQHYHPESPEWEDYNQNEWDESIEGEDFLLDDGSADHDAPRPALFIHPNLNWIDEPSSSKAKPSVPLTDATFVRALKDSDTGSKPYFKKGDILRIVGHRRRGDLYYELLPLKPPGEVGRVLRKDLEAADQAAVDDVGREARTGKEKECYRCAVEWDN